MGLSITKKILMSHIIEGKMIENEQITIRVDQTLCHDLTGIMAALMLESVNPDKVRTKRAIFYCDHNTLATSTENSDDHLYLKTVAQRYGAYYSKPGNGICHILHLQRFARPGEVLIGADSHTPTSGALGMLAIGSGGLSVSKCMLGEGFKMVSPKVFNIKLTGRLKPTVSAKDIALELLRILSVKGGTGYILEYSGEGIESLSIPERATIANMSIEVGATAGIFPSDQVAYEFLRVQGREGDWLELLPDKDAEYDRFIEIDLGELEPLVAKPHMPDLVVKVKELGDVRPNSVFIGSCTNSSYLDIKKAARILKGKKVHKDIDLYIAPGSRQILLHLIQDGMLADLVEAGARILECSCGPCAGIGQVPPAKGVSLRTSNRNFQGRSGTSDAFVYLSSPETASATAITGRITDPREIIDPDILWDFREPARYIIEDSMFITPDDIVDNKKVEIIRGNNIVPLPRRGPLRDNIEAKVVIKLGDNITTDDIIPTGMEILKYISNTPRLAEYTFFHIDPTFAKRAKNFKSSIIIGGENYGQGSSREHAALLPMFLGVEVVIAKSYARIHKENLINYGILPLIFKNKDDYEKIEEGDLLKIDDLYRKIEKGEVRVKVEDRDFVFDTLLEVSDFDRLMLKEGGVTNYLRNRMR